MKGSEGHWFPFSSTEVEVALALFALMESGLYILDVSRDVHVVSAAAFFGVAYVSGLFAHSRRDRFSLHVDGALGGRGYLPHFRHAKKSLLLLHTDDDPPCAELLGLYRTLLERGVEIRRIIFLRPERRPGAFAWVEDFGEHPQLSQRAVRPEHAAHTRHSFVVVDEAVVLLSVPGGEAIHGEEYSTALTLRHLLAFEGEEAGKAFAEIHGQLWRRAAPFEVGRASQL